MFIECDFFEEIEIFLEVATRNAESHPDSDERSIGQTTKKILERLLRFDHPEKELKIYQTYDDENSPCGCCDGYNETRFEVYLESENSDKKLVCQITNIYSEDCFPGDYTMGCSVEIEEIDEDFQVFKDLRDEEDLKELNTLVLKELLEKTTLKE
jgi:hypothetical protein